MKTSWLALLSFAVMLSGVARSQDLQDTPARVTVDPVRSLTVKPGQHAPVQFTFHIKTGFHVNSHQPLEPELIPTEIKFSPPEDLVIAKVQYPAGNLMSFPFDPTTKLSVYSGAVTVRAIVLTAPKAVAGRYTVHGQLRYQACNDNSCFPPKDVPVSFNVRISSGVARRGARPTRTSPHIHN